MSLTPLFSIERCDMPCCETVEISCCEKDKPMDCPMEMSECRVSSFIPLMAAPLNEVNVSKEYDISELMHIWLELDQFHPSIQPIHNFSFQHPPEYFIPLIC